MRESFPDVTVYRVTDAFRGPRLVRATYTMHYVEDGIFPSILWTCVNWRRDPVLRRCFSQTMAGSSVGWWNLSTTPEGAWTSYERDCRLDMRRAEESVGLCGARLKRAGIRKQKGAWNEGKE
jgi:hypothetical protein